MSHHHGGKLPGMSTAHATQGPHPASAPIPLLTAAPGPASTTAPLSAATPLSGARPLPTLATILAPRHPTQNTSYRGPARSMHLATSSFLGAHPVTVPISRDPAVPVVSSPALPKQNAPSTPAVYSNLSHSTAPETSRSATTTPTESAPQKVTPSFQELVVDMMSNPSFPLVLKKVLEIFTGCEVNIQNCNTRLKTADSDVRMLSNFANTNGVEEACARSSSLDVFLAAALTSLENIKNRDSGLALSHDLNCTISTGAQLVSNQYPSVGAPASSYPSIQVPNRRSFSGGSTHPRQTAPGPRPKLSAEAREVMEAWFRNHYDRPYPSDADKLELARKCGIQLNQVNNFFGNKRMRLKRKAMSALQREDTPAAAADSGAGKVDPSSVLAPQAKWRAVVLAKFPNAPGGSANGGHDVPARQRDAADTSVAQPRFRGLSNT